MKKNVAIILLSSLFLNQISAQFDLNSLKKQAEGLLKVGKASSDTSKGGAKSTEATILEGLGGLLGGGSASEMTQSKASEGLKSALKAGTDFASSRLGRVDGFLADAAVKILFPPEAKKIENTLRKMGLNKQCNDIITTINRAAESAVVEAKPIFAAAITQMTLTDAIGILTGGEGAATNYLKRTSGNALIEKFAPIISSHLNKSGATKHWGTAMKTYNRLPMVEKVNPDLTQFVTQKAVDGIFLKVQEEENKIRSNPAARATAILQDVFGWADKQKK